MKNTVLILLLTITYFTYCQNTIIVDYKILTSDFIPKDKLVNDPITKDLYKKINENKEKISYKLTGTKKGFIFQKKLSMSIDKDDLIVNIANLAVGFPDAEYNGIDDKFYEILDNVKILQDLQYNWTLTDSIKYIDNFKCIYAIGTCLENSNSSSKPITCSAWFSPDISFNYGPGGVTNLPGLVLEFEKGNRKVVAKKIILNEDEVVLKYFKHKIISSEEYRKSLPYKP